MDSYRDDIGALHEQLETLKRELEETKRSLEKAHASAASSKRAAQSFESELKRAARPVPSRPPWTLAIAAFLGLMVGVLVESGLSTRRLRDMQSGFDTRLASCQEQLSTCRALRP